MTQTIHDPQNKHFKFLERYVPSYPIPNTVGNAWARTLCRRYPDSMQKLECSAFVLLKNVMEVGHLHTALDDVDAERRAPGGSG